MVKEISLRYLLQITVKLSILPTQAVAIKAGSDASERVFTLEFNLEARICLRESVVRFFELVKHRVPQGSVIYPVLYYSNVVDIEFQPLDG